VSHPGLVLLATHLEVSGNAYCADDRQFDHQNVARLSNYVKNADAVAQLFMAAGFDTCCCSKVSAMWISSARFANSGSCQRCLYPGRLL